eukprot:scpid40829/ scgid13886/ 
MTAIKFFSSAFLFAAVALVVTLSLCFPVANSAPVPQLKFYVSPSGDDKWSGLLPKPNAAHSDGPVATVQQAASLSRDYPAEPVIVIIEEGTYYFESTLDMDSLYNRSAEAPLTFSGCPNTGLRSTVDPAEFPVLSGGIKLTNYRELDDGNYYINVPETVKPDTPITQLFVNGQREPVARKPNTGYLYWKSPIEPCHKIEDLSVDLPSDWRSIAGSPGCPDIDKYGFVFEPGDISKEWTNLNESWINVFAAWSATWHHIKSVDFNMNIVKFVEPSNYAVGTFPEPSGRRYFVENVLEELDAPGEWYHKRNESFILYKPRKAGPQTLDIILPVLHHVISLSDLQHVNFECLTVEHALEGYDKRQAYHTTEGAITLSRCSDITISMCDVKHTGASGIFIGQSSSRVTVDSCRTADCGGDGISMDEKSTDIMISNNIVNTSGFIYMMQPTGIRVQGQRNITVEHNEVWNVPYAAIMIGWQDGYPWVAHGSPGHYVFTAQHNHVHDYGLGILNDFGGVYVSAQVSCWQLPPSETRPSCNMATRVEQNIMHGAECYQYGADGFYSDEDAAGVDVVSNLIYDVASAGIYFHCGVNLTSVNNFVINADMNGHRGALSGCNMGGFSKPVTIDFQFEHNILYVLGKNSHLVSEYTKMENSTFDDNIYFSPDVTLQFPNKTTFAQWQANGKDKSSIIADPLFSNVQERDFRLTAKSPATKMGITAIDIESVGPHNNPFTRSHLAEWTPLVPLQSRKRRPQI